MTDTVFCQKALDKKPTWLYKGSKALTKSPPR